MPGLSFFSTISPACQTETWRFLRFGSLEADAGDDAEDVADVEDTEVVEGLEDVDVADVEGVEVEDVEDVEDVDVEVEVVEVVEVGDNPAEEIDAWFALGGGGLLPSSERSPRVALRSPVFQERGYSHAALVGRDSLSFSFLRRRITL